MNENEIKMRTLLSILVDLTHTDTDHTQLNKETFKYCQGCWMLNPSFCCSLVLLVQLKRRDVAEPRNLMNCVNSELEENQDIDGAKWKTKVSSSPLLSPLAPTASWAQLSTWLGCCHWQAARAMKQDGTRDLGHLDNTRPHNLQSPNPLF